MNSFFILRKVTIGMKQSTRKISNRKKQITKKIQISNQKSDPFVFFLPFLSFFFWFLFFGSFSGLLYADSQCK